MSYTPFSDEQYNQSLNIHQKERNNIYPLIYGVRKENVSYDDDMPEYIKKIQDYEKARDVTFKVKYPLWEYPVNYSSQFRIREIDAQKFQDLTITLKNPDSNSPGELFKLQADVFPYGYQDQNGERLIELLVADCPKLRNGIINDTLQYEIRYNPRSHQPFVAIKFAELYKHHIVILHWKEPKGKRYFLHGGPRQVDPNVSFARGMERASQGYTAKGEHRDALTQDEKNIVSRNIPNWWNQD